MVNKNVISVLSCIVMLGSAQFLSGSDGGAIGPAAAQNCHVSYELVCIAPGRSDVDCAGGTGNGPRYARGPIRVVGVDQYRLDRDGDGIACER